MLYAFALGFGFSVGGLAVMIGTQIHLFFGPEAVATPARVLVFAQTCGGALGVWAGGKIFDLTGSYVLAFGLGAVLCFVGLGLSVGLRRQAGRPIPSVVSVNG